MPECTFFTYATPVGKMTIACNGRAITHAVPGDVLFPGVRKPCTLTNSAANQLQEYLAGKRRYFDLPLEPEGTEFQRKVWSEASDIPYGVSRTFADLAAAIGSPGSSKAVGVAIARNPILVFIPCHRVLGSNGRHTVDLHSAEVKRFLLELERRSE